MVNKEIFLNQLFNFYKDDKKALNYLKTSSSIPFLEYQDFIHLIELNMWNALIFLIENEKIEINYKNIENENLLLISASKYNFDNNQLYLNFIDNLIKNGLNINCENTLNQNILLVLLSNKNASKLLTVNLIDELENKGLIIIDKDNQHYSLSSSISRYASYEIFQHLYPRCNKSYIDNEGNSMFLNACANPDINVLKFLIKQGFTDFPNQDNKNACNIALETRNIKTYKYLIENNFSHPNQIKDELFISFSQSFNLYYMLNNSNFEEEAKNWLSYYFDTIDLKIFNVKQIDKLHDMYLSFSYNDQFFEASKILYEKKRLENKVKVSFLNNNKLKI